MSHQNMLRIKVILKPVLQHSYKLWKDLDNHTYNLNIKFYKNPFKSQFFSKHIYRRHKMYR